MIRNYLRELESVLASRPWVAEIEVVRCDVTDLDALSVLLYRFHVHLRDGGLLEMMERVVAERAAPLSHTTYRFHRQDGDGRLVRRWDNAPHHPLLPGFPHHLHLGSEQNAVPAEPIAGVALLREMDRLAGQIS